MRSEKWHSRFIGTRPLSPETLMMGYGYDPHLSERSLKPPVFLTSTFVFRTAEDGKALQPIALLRPSGQRAVFDLVVHQRLGEAEAVLRVFAPRFRAVLTGRIAAAFKRLGRTEDQLAEPPADAGGGSDITSHGGKWE